MLYFSACVLCEYAIQRAFEWAVERENECHAHSIFHMFFGAYILLFWFFSFLLLLVWCSHMYSLISIFNLYQLCVCVYNVYTMILLLMQYYDWLSVRVDEVRLGGCNNLKMSDHHPIMSGQSFYQLFIFNKFNVIHVCKRFIVKWCGRFMKSQKVTLIEQIDGCSRRNSTIKLPGMEIKWNKSEFSNRMTEIHLAHML